MIDIGANLTNKRFHKDLDDVLLRAENAGVEKIIVTGTSLESSQAAIALAKQHSVLSATVGVHPHDAKTWDDHSADKVMAWLTQPEVVAGGECGLDFNRDFSPRDQQISCFEAQLELAVRHQKPVFLHERDAHDTFLAILKPYRDKLSGAVVHCFTGNQTALHAYLDLGCHIGITGWVCDENRGKALRQLVPSIPNHRLMIETDAPYLTPKNLPKKPKNGRNEPALLTHVLTTIADLKGTPADQLARDIRQTTDAFFSFPSAS